MPLAEDDVSHKVRFARCLVGRTGPESSKKIGAATNFLVVVPIRPVSRTIRARRSLSAEPFHRVGFGSRQGAGGFHS